MPARRRFPPPWSSMKIPLVILGYAAAACALTEIQTVVGMNAAWIAFGVIALLMAAIGIRMSATGNALNR